MRRLLLATRNPGKVAEISAILAGIPFELTGVNDIPSAPEVVEDGATVEENALKKVE